MKESTACLIMFIVFVGGHFLHSEDSNITMNALTGLAAFFGVSFLYLNGQEWKKNNEL